MNRFVVHGSPVQGTAFAERALGTARKGRPDRVAPPEGRTGVPRAENPPAQRVALGILMQRWDGVERPFGLMTPFAETVTNLARTVGVDVLCFGPEDVIQETEQVRASRFLGARGGWTREERPLPHVLWNRYLRRDQGELLAWLSQRQIPFLNERHLNKWEAYQCLWGDEALRLFLPETAVLTEAGTAMEMLERHPVVYLKPIAGAAGRGIMRARQSGPGLVQLEYISAETGMLKEAFVGKPQLDRWLASNGRAGRYIVQQGLQLNVFHGRPADVRVLMQKDGHGVWGVTGMGCRVAGHGRFTANLHTGGQGVPVDLLIDAVEAREPCCREGLRCQIESLAVQVATRIESVAGPMGELGLDFGIDTQGRLWHIEQNAQPGRAIFAHMGRWDLSDLAHLRPVQYAKYLAAGKGAESAPAQAT